MRKNLTLIIYILAIGLLVALTGVIILKLLFWPPCTPIGANDTTCVVDGWSIAGLAATVLGVAAAILALLGAFAVAAWWNDLNKRVSEQIADIFQEEKRNLQDALKEAEALKEERKAEINQYKHFQAELRDKINAVGKLEKYVELQNAVTISIEDTNRALMYLILGNQLIEQKRIAEAVDAYEKVKALRPDDPQVNYILGRTYSSIGSSDKAIACLEISVAGDESFVAAHHELGLAYRNRADKLYADLRDEIQREEEYDKSIEQLKMAIKLQPNFEEALGSLGGTYKRTKDYKRALIYYKRLLSINDDSSYALGNIAMLSWHEGDIQAAREIFERNEEMASKRIDAGSYEPYWDYFDRGIARLVLNNKVAALADYHTAVKLTRNLEHCRAVLEGLKFLREVENRYPIDGLDEALEMTSEAMAEAEARVAGSHIG